MVVNRHQLIFFLLLIISISNGSKTYKNISQETIKENLPDSYTIYDPDKKLTKSYFFTDDNRVIILLPVETKGTNRPILVPFLIDTGKFETYLTPSTAQQLKVSTKIETEITIKSIRLNKFKLNRHTNVVGLNVINRVHLLVDYKEKIVQFHFDHTKKVPANEKYNSIFSHFDGEYLNVEMSRLAEEVKKYSLETESDIERLERRNKAYFSMRNKISDRILKLRGKLVEKDEDVKKDEQEEHNQTSLYSETTEMFFQNYNHTVLTNQKQVFSHMTTSETFEEGDFLIENLVLNPIYNEMRFIVPFMVVTGSPSTTLCRLTRKLLKIGYKYNLQGVLIDMNPSYGEYRDINIIGADYLSQNILFVDKGKISLIHLEDERYNRGYDSFVKEYVERTSNDGQIQLEQTFSFIQLLKKRQSMYYKHLAVQLMQSQNEDEIKAYLDQQIKDNEAHVNLINKKRKTLERRIRDEL